MARMFSIIFRFIDHLCTFNNDEFGNNHNDAYSKWVRTQKQQPFWTFPCKATFLDLSVEIQDRKVTTGLFNEKDTLPFYINFFQQNDLHNERKSKIKYIQQCPNWYFVTKKGNVKTIANKITEQNYLKWKVSLEMKSAIKVKLK